MAAEWLLTLAYPPLPAAIEPRDRLSLFARLLSQSAQASVPIAMIPSGTPTPAPIATSCELLEPDADEDGDEEDVVELAVTVIVEVELVEVEDASVTFASAARPRMISASSKRKLSPYGQTISVPL